jgi:heme-degrading monooxygenase HmoA
MGGSVVTGEVRVLLYHSTDDVAGIAAAYHEVSRNLVAVPGLLGNELLHSTQDPREFVVLSSWRSWEAFQHWEQGQTHQQRTTPLRPYRDTGLARPFGVYRVMAAY